MKEIEIFRKLLSWEKLDRAVEINYELNYDQYSYTQRLTLTYPLDISSSVENLVKISSLSKYLTGQNITLTSDDTSKYIVEDIFSI